jgi:hypothetical protein
MVDSGSAGSQGTSLGDSIEGGVEVAFGEATSATVDGGGTLVVWGAGDEADETTLNSGSCKLGSYP